MSTLKLYKVAFKKESNAYVDGLASYLESCDKLIMNDFQHIKHDLTISIKINMNQKYVDDFQYNYVSINNDEPSEKDKYYYINNTAWISENTIKLDLMLDTVNTLGQEAASVCNPRNFDNRTQITREHQDRFIQPATTYNHTISNTLTRKVDPESEATISNKLLKSDNVLQGSTTSQPSETNWYLIYRTRDGLTEENISNPIATYLVANKPFKTTGAALPTKTYTYSDFIDGTYYYMIDLDNPQGTVNGYTFGTNYNTVANITFNNNVPSATMASRKYRGIMLHRSGNTLYYLNMFDDLTAWYKSNPITTIQRLNSPAIPTSTTPVAVNNETGWKSTASVVISQGSMFRTSFDDLYLQSAEGIKVLATTTVNIGIGSGLPTVTIDSVDRTDSRLMKILKLPYCPIKLTKTVSSGITYYALPTGWIYEAGLLKWNCDFLPTFINPDITSITTYITSDLKATLPAIDKSDARRTTGVNGVKLNMESKLLHSDFHTTKVVYDSFQFPITYEDWPQDNATTPSVSIDFKQSSNINSTFAFKFKFTPSTHEKTDDFNDYMIINRSNEELICSNDYVNYVRNGIGYDKTSNKLALNQAKVNALLSLGSAAASAIPAFKAAKLANRLSGAASEFWDNNMPQDPHTAFSQSDMSVANAIFKLQNKSTASTNNIAYNQTIGIASNAVQSVSNLIFLAENQKNEMKAKLASLAAQSTNVSSNDDVDLMTWYSDNKLHVIKYDIKEFVKNKVVDMLYYAGYSHNQQEAPNVNSRIWFNFLQCEPIITNTQGIKESWLADLKTRYGLGVTVFHHNSINGANTYDFDQVKENYEAWMFN